MPFYPPSVRYPRIFQDVPCDRCGYNLRGMHVGGQCPECGQFTFSSYNRHRARAFDLPEFSVGATDDPETPRVRGVYKHFRRLDPGWLGKLAMGCALLVAGNVLSAGFAWYTWIMQSLGEFPQSARWMMHLTAWGLCAAGAILIVTPQPGTARRYERPVFGVARVCAAAWFLTPVLVFSGHRDELGRIGLVMLAGPVSVVMMLAVARALAELERKRVAVQAAVLACILPVIAVVLASLIPADKGAHKLFFELAPVPGIGSGSTMLAFTDRFRGLMGPRSSVGTLIAMGTLVVFVWAQVVMLMAWVELRQARRRFGGMGVALGRGGREALPGN